VCERLGLEGHTFLAGDAREVSLEGTFAGAYVLDVMHHIPARDQLPLLERLRDVLAPRGVLVVKDITTEPRIGLKFTEILHGWRVVGGEPLVYRHHREGGEMLESLGFHVRMVRVPDV